jgi:hypothetical protein
MAWKMRMMLERGLVKFDDNFVHVSSILPPFFPVNVPSYGITHHSYGMMAE